MPGWYERLGMIAVFLVLGFFGAVGLMAAFRHWQARRRVGEPLPPEVFGIPRDPELPHGFGYKTNWIAVRSTRPDRVAELAGGTAVVDPPVVANWADGIDSACRGDAVFVTPVVQGWVFVVGIRFWPNMLHLQGFLERISEIEGEASAYWSMRVSSAYGWARAVNGQLVRFFDLNDGEVAHDIGRRSSVENELCPNWESVEEVMVHIDEESVLEIAEAWSLDPRSLDDRNEPRTPGSLYKWMDAHAIANHEGSK